MIPGATIRGVPTGPCRPDGPCWIAGTGFRPVILTDAACVVDDAPIAAKVPPGWMITDLPVDVWAVLPDVSDAPVLAGAPWSGGILGLDDEAMPCCIIREPAEPLPDLAPVPIEASAALLLLVAVGLLDMLRRLLR